MKKFLFNFLDKVKRKSDLKNFLWENEQGSPNISLHISLPISIHAIFIFIEKRMCFDINSQEMVLLYPTSLSVEDSLRPSNSFKGSGCPHFKVILYNKQIMFNYSFCWWNIQNNANQIQCFTWKFWAKCSWKRLFQIIQRA